MTARGELNDEGKGEENKRIEVRRRTRVREGE